MWWLSHCCCEFKESVRVFQSIEGVGWAGLRCLAVTSGWQQLLEALQVRCLGFPTDFVHVDCSCVVVWPVVVSSLYGPLLSPVCL